jgi:hypothetical protein
MEAHSPPVLDAGNVQNRTSGYDEDGPSRRDEAVAPENGESAPWRWRSKKAVK